MIIVNVMSPHKLTGIYRARFLRMPDMDEPVTVYYRGFEVGKGKVIAVNIEKRTYDVEMQEQEKKP